MHRYFIIYKPYQVLSQFSKEGDKKTLKDFFAVPADVYPVGRLDYDSEGLLILTNNKSLNHRLLNPRFAHERNYWVQVEGAVTTHALQQLQTGVDINLDGTSYTTKKAKAFLLEFPPPVPERIPGIRFRKNIPAPWLSLILTEGKNRQVRKMTAAVGFPTLRLIRYSIEKLNIEGMLPGQIKALDEDTIFKNLFGK